MPTDTETPFDDSVVFAQAELALLTLKKQVLVHSEQRSRLDQLQRDWHLEFVNRSEQIRHQIDQLQARLAPWIPRDSKPVLGVVSFGEEAA